MTTTGESKRDNTSQVEQTAEEILKKVEQPKEVEGGKTASLNFNSL